MASRGSAAVVVIYSMVVLGFVATTPDIGIRCLMFDDALAKRRRRMAS